MANPASVINPTTNITRSEFNDFDYVIDKSQILLKYPRSIGADERENSPAILFKFHSPTGSRTTPPGVVDVLGASGQYIALPIPVDISFDDKYKLSDGSLTTYLQSIRRAWEKVKAMATLNGQDFDMRTSGRAWNSRAAVTFESPDFRNYSFSWDLVARTEDEARDIQRIIKAFRIAAASQFEGGDETAEKLIYPDLCSFVIVTGSDQFPFPASYACFIESFKYNPIPNENQQSFHFDGSPLGWKISLELKESMWLDRKDINKGFGTLSF